jgi:hypothetical protein
VRRDLQDRELLGAGHGSSLGAPCREPVTVTVHSADGPIGLTNSGTPVTIGVVTVGDSDCSADTQLDKLVVRIVQIR